MQYISINLTLNNDQSDTTRRIENAFIRELYKQAHDHTDGLLLQQCNQLFANTKQVKGKDGSDRDKDTDRLARSRKIGGDQVSNQYHIPDLLEIYPNLVKTLQKRVVLVIDVGNGLPEADQIRLAERLIKLRNLPNIHVGVLVLCRLSSPIRFKLTNENVAQILMGDHNKRDIKLLIDKGLQKIPNLSSTEKTEIEDTVLQKTGHRIQYAAKIALPFLCTPFKRPITAWLKNLPEDVNETYHQHLHQLAPGYDQLLKKALAWTLVAQTPFRVDEIMEAYSEVYTDSNANERQSMEMTNLDLYREQIQKAGGPFLDIRDEQYVVLADAQAVRKFCRSSLDASAPGAGNGSICARCKTALPANVSVALSEKQEHLAMAIICCKSHARVKRVK